MNDWKDLFLVSIPEGRLTSRALHVLGEHNFPKASRAMQWPAMRYNCLPQRADGHRINHGRRVLIVADSRDQILLGASFCGLHPQPCTSDFCRHQCCQKRRSPRMLLHEKRCVDAVSKRSIFSTVKAAKKSNRGMDAAQTSSFQTRTFFKRTQNRTMCPLPLPFRNPKFFDFKRTSEDSFSALWTPIFARYKLLVGLKFLFGCTSFASFCTERSQSSLRNLATLFQLSSTDTFYWISSHMLRCCVKFIHI